MRAKGLKRRKVACDNCQARNNRVREVKIWNKHMNLCVECVAALKRILEQEKGAAA